MAKVELSGKSERSRVQKGSGGGVEVTLVHLAYPRYDVDTRDTSEATPAKQNVPCSAAARTVYCRGSPRVIASDGRYIPTTRQAVHNSTFTEEALSTPERQFVEKACHQALRGIQLADSLLCPPIVGILANEAVCADETGNTGSGRVRVSNVLRDCVGHQETQSLRKAFFQSKLHRVIRGVARAVRSERVIFLIELTLLR